MPYKSKAQAAYFNIHRKELERQGVDVDEWNESTRGKKLPDKVKKEKRASDIFEFINKFKLLTKLAQEAELNDPAKQFSEKLVETGLTHRAIDTAATNMTRRGPIAPLLNNYYANSAKEGLNASVTGNDVMPRYRRALGVISPSLTGLTDYEIARDVGHNIKQHAAENGQKINSLNELIEHPMMQQALGNIDKNNSSPITKNIANAMDPKLKQNGIIESFKRFGGMAPDAQHYSSRVGGLMGAGLGYAEGGPAGAVSSLINMSPDLAMSSIANRNVAPIAALKHGVMGKGMQHGLNGTANNTRNKLLATGLNIANPATAEVYDFGKDVGQQIVKQNNPENLTKIFGDNPHLTGLAQQGVTQTAENEAQNMISPAAKMLNPKNITKNITNFAARNKPYLIIGASRLGGGVAVDMLGRHFIPEGNNSTFNGYMGNVAKDLGVGAVSGAVSGGLPGAALGAATGAHQNIHRQINDLNSAIDGTEASSNSLNNVTKQLNVSRANHPENSPNALFARNGMQYNGSTKPATPILTKNISSAASAINKSNNGVLSNLFKKAGLFNGRQIPDAVLAAIQRGDSSLLSRMGINGNKVKARQNAFPRMNSLPTDTPNPRAITPEQLSLGLPVRRPAAPYDRSNYIHNDSHGGMILPSAADLALWRSNPYIK